MRDHDGEVERGAGRHVIGNIRRMLDTPRADPGDEFEDEFRRLARRRIRRRRRDIGRRIRRRRVVVSSAVVLLMLAIGYVVAVVMPGWSARGRTAARPVAPPSISAADSAPPDTRARNAVRDVGPSVAVSPPAAAAADATRTAARAGATRGATAENRDATVPAPEHAASRARAIPDPPPGSGAASERLRSGGAPSPPPPASELPRRTAAGTPAAPAPAPAGGGGRTNAASQFLDRDRAGVGDEGASGLAPRSETASGVARAPDSIHGIAVEAPPGGGEAGSGPAAALDAVGRPGAPSRETPASLSSAGAGSARTLPPARSSIADQSRTPADSAPSVASPRPARASAAPSKPESRAARNARSGDDPPLELPPRSDAPARSPRTDAAALSPRTDPSRSETSIPRDDQGTLRVGVRIAVSEWIAASRLRDLDKLIGAYAPVLEVFEDDRDVSRESVRAEKARVLEALGEWHAGEPTIELAPDGQRASARIPLTYVNARAGRSESRVRELGLVHTPEGWRIESERDIARLR